jgi:hypothetical protein
MLLMKYFFIHNIRIITNDEQFAMRRIYKNGLFINLKVKKV